MVLRTLIILLAILALGSPGKLEAASTKKLLKLRAKLGRALKKSSFYRPKMNYTRFKNRVRRKKRGRKISRAQREAFLKLAQINAVLYAKTTKLKYKKEALNSLYVAEAFRYKRSTTKVLRRKILKTDKLIKKKKQLAKKKMLAKKRKKEKEKRKPKVVKLKDKFSFYGSFVSWQEDRTAKDQAGSEFLLFAQLRGYCVGLAYEFVYKNVHMTSHGCLLLGSIDIAGEQSNVYSKSEISTMGLISGAGISFDHLSRQFTSTLGLDLIYRSNDWPEAGTLEIDGDSLITLGLYYQSELRRGRSAFDFKFGYGFAFLSAYWQIGYKYYY